MHCCAFSKPTLVLICFFSVALAVQAQNPPVFTPGQQVTELSQAAKVLAADVNNDGFADLVALELNSSGSRVVIYISNGDGTFRAPIQVLEGTSPSDIAVGDFNQDGNLDIAVATNAGPFDQTGQGTVTVIFGNGQGNFGSAQIYPVGGIVAGIATGDFNNDGRMDVAALGVFSKSITVLTNTGGAFTSSSFTVPTHFDTANPGFFPDLLTSIVAGDFNGDGKMDLVYQDSCGDSGCGVSQEAYFLLTNTGSGFTPTLLSFASTGASALHSADLDGDGRSDIYFAFHGCHTPCSGVTVAYSNGDGTFQTVPAFDGTSNTPAGDPFDLIAGDFNNDGVMDIAAATGSSPNANPGLDIYLGKGGRSGFAAPVHIDSPNGVNASPFRIAAGFVNHDGSKDILLVENGDFIPFFNKSSLNQDACPYPDDPGIDFCMDPAPHNSPVRFLGSFHAPTQPANRIELWIDGKKVVQVFDDLINVSVPLTPGSHQATLVGVSATGQLFKAIGSSFTVEPGPCPIPASAGVSICQPAPGSTVGSPTQVNASATAPPGRTITAMRIYIDNQAKLTVNGNTILGDIDLPSGNHSLVVVAWDNTGASQTKSENFNVVGGSAPCLPTSPGIRVCTPAPDATVSSPVEVSAGATPTAGQRITAIRVYLDNTAIYFDANNGTSNSFSIDTGLAMPAGTHRLVIVAYQNNGSTTSFQTIAVH